MTPAPIGRAVQAPLTTIGARILLTLPFLWSGFSKLFDFPSAIAEMRHFGLEPAVAIATATLAVQLVASLAIVVGRFTWLAAGALGLFTGFATIVAHRFWTISEPVARFHEMNAFLANVAIIGGLILASSLAATPCAPSLWRPREPRPRTAS